MTKAQAREYATRIRLGEPLYWWLSRYTGHRPSNVGACFADGTGVAYPKAGLWALNSTPAPNCRERWEPLHPQAARLVLALLDKLANS